MPSDRIIRWVIKPVVFAAALFPFAHLLWRAINSDLTADPLVEITNETGIWTLAARRDHARADAGTAGNRMARARRDSGA